MKTPRFWQEHSLASTALLPLAGLYGVGAWLDRTFTKAQTAPLSILAIGNATAGGAGKTPTALALAPLLRELGHIPHFATRGYGAATPLHAHRVSDKDDAAHVGDEALLLARIAPTWVGRDRLAAANAAREAGATLLICDDALQHHRLKKDLTLLVIDGPFGIGNGRLLPAGPLREPFSTALTRSDAAIFIGADSQQLAAAIEQPIFHAHLAPSANMPSLKDGPYLAFAGIGRPEKFFASLREQGAHLIATHPFPDHHPYLETEIAALITEAGRQGAKLITTEKDMVRLPPLYHEQISVFPVELSFNEVGSLRQFLATKLRG